MTSASVYSISAASSFLDSCASWLIDQAKTTEISLTDWWVFLPSQRARRAFCEALLSASDGNALLLPRISVLGEVDEDAFLLESHVPQSLREAWLALPEPISRAEQSLQLSTMLQDTSRQAGREMSLGYATQMASTLTPLLDECEREAIPLERLGRAVPQDYAEHWREQAQLLRVVAHEWPKWLQQQGKVSVIERRNQEMALFAAYIRMLDNDMPIVAAGSTASVPATADLLRAIANKAHGYVLLPGVEAKESIDQTYMHDWLHKQNLTPGEVPIIGDLKNSNLPNVSIASNTEHEAAAIALMLRETIEENTQRTAALVTYDSQLAERVSMHLRRAGIVAHYSAGEGVQNTLAGRLVRLLLECVEQSFAPVAFSALLKHGGIRVGFSAAEYHQAIATFERVCLRGRRRYRTLAQLQAQAERTIEDDEHAAIIQAVLRHCAPLDALMHKRFVPLADVVEALLEVINALVSDGSGTLFLQDHEGEREVFESLQTLGGSLHATLKIEAKESSRIITDWLSHGSIRPRNPKNQRVFMLTPQEARLLSFDRIVIGGMNEGHWPTTTRQHVWLNRGMRIQLGLGADPAREALAAHDFYQLASQPNVIISYSREVNGSPAQPAKILQRYEHQLARHKKELALMPCYVHWALPKSNAGKVATPPKPIPPVEARPTDVSPTAVEQLIRDPYGYYAKYILQLKALDPLDREVDMALFGDVVHRALERWAQGDEQQRMDVKRLEAIGYTLFSQFFHEPQVEQLWWPRFQRLAEAFVAHAARDEQWRNAVIEAEISHEHTIQVGDNDVCLKARLDRLDTRQGGIRIIDYKTGTLPSRTEVKEGWSPQLLLQWLACAHNNEHVSVTLNYWKTSGGREPLTLQENLSESGVELFEGVAECFAALMKHYLTDEVPYLAQPITSKAPRYNDYAYLERIAEWG